MKEHPIVFNNEMVQAILDGRKTQTRIIIRPQPYETEMCPVMVCEDVQSPSGYTFASDRFDDRHIRAKYQVGDKLWVRERINNGLQACNFYYHADNKGVGNHIYKQLCDYGWTLKKVIPNNRMPKWATRIWLEIINIRVERVQDIDNNWDDCLREGAVPKDMAICDCNGTHQKALWMFKELWDSLNAKRGCGWDENLWVWVIEFKRIQPKSI